MEIIPEGPTDESYLEMVFGLKGDGDAVIGKRVNAMGLSCWSFLEIKCKEPK
jgi:hypothetical protein